MATSVLAILCLVVAATFTWKVVIGFGRIGSLREQPISIDGAWPSVSIIVAARNEARDLTPALQSLLDLDYPNLELVFVDDRSEDETAEVVDRFAEHESRMRVIHIEELPHGWLGKNHALWRGAEVAQGEYLLFTDADVAFAPTSIRQAMTYVVRERLDHLTVSPDIEVPGWLLKAMVVTFSMFFASFFTPWRSRDPRHPAFVGIGAFNLVRRSAYAKVGGHETIKMRPDDDMKLGKIIKRAGLRQDILSGSHAVSVPWYHSFRELVHGLEKNMFSGVDYQVAVVVVATAIGVLSFVWPFVAVWIVTGADRGIYGVSVLLLWGAAMATATKLRYAAWIGLLFPMTTLLLFWIQWRAMFLTLRNRGIRWRGNHYPLDLLKANRV